MRTAFDPRDRSSPSAERHALGTRTVTRSCLGDPVDRRHVTLSGYARTAHSSERPRLRRRGRAPAPGRGPAVVAAARPDPTALASRVKGAARSCGPACGRP
jgi:hypothetical protein